MQAKTKQSNNKKSQHADDGGIGRGGLADPPLLRSPPRLSGRAAGRAHFARSRRPAGAALRAASHGTQCVCKCVVRAAVRSGRSSKGQWHRRRRAPYQACRVCQRCDNHECALPADRKDKSTHAARPKLAAAPWTLDRSVQIQRQT